MTIDPTIALRLQFLVRVMRKECRHRVSAGRRLFGAPFTQGKAMQLEADADLVERVEAFVGRFGRLQDTIGDRFLPVFLMALSETPADACRRSQWLDGGNRAARLGGMKPCAQGEAGRGGTENYPF